MRSLGLISVIVALNSLLHVSAVPTPATGSKAFNIPGIGDLTLGVILPTNIPSPNTPDSKVPGVPIRRAHDNGLVQPRMVTSPDYEASGSNATLPNAALTSHAPSPTPGLERRVAKSKADHKQSKASHGSGTEGSPLSAGPAGNGASGVKSLGAIPKKMSSIFYSLPLSSPDTPLAHSEAPHSEAEASPVSNEEEAPVDPGAYPTAPRYEQSSNPAPDNNPAATPVEEKRRRDQPKRRDLFEDSATLEAPARKARMYTKRHGLVLDTDPLLPPQDDVERDPRMGLLNVDSNQKPDPKVAPKVPAGDGPDVVAPQGTPISPEHPNVARDSQVVSA
ncbi:hypothetical protein PHLCEN_2v7293 [Hermanssonia centrifuga]|uniref:Uncharacterized protein n=1 Tax=Hermanssonia centrifuga TaxID=98765 RepID=A0A2R6NWZ3_9APHY|nr:hypothetical protein PHLCEN_2v7293 [Hermanssonia centrifuga]